VKRKSNLALGQILWLGQIFAAQFFSSNIDILLKLQQQICAFAGLVAVL